MAMVALAGFIVVTHHAYATGDQSHSIFEAMSAGANRLWNLPNHDLKEDEIAQMAPDTMNELRPASQAYATHRMM